MPGTVDHDNDHEHAAVWRPVPTECPTQAPESFYSPLNVFEFISPSDAFAIDY